jgi:hypothetical protein
MTLIEQFPTHSRVLLECCRHGQPGFVTGHARGKVIVEWRDLGIVGRHSPDRLRLAVPEAAQRDARPVTAGGVLNAGSAVRECGGKARV